MSHGQITVTMLGSGTSAGVPMIGCHCPVCSSPDPHDQRTRPSIVVSYEHHGQPHNILIDTTPELRLQAIREKIDRISAVVFTHAHADHIMGMDDVRRYNALTGHPLPTFASTQTMETLRRAFAYAFEPKPPPNTQYQDAIFRPELVPTVIDGPFNLFGRQWLPIELLHGRFRVLGFRIGNFAYCTDCNQIPPESLQLLQGLDTLIIDGLRPRPHPTHLSFEEALAIIQQLKAKRAYFTHLSHDLRHTQITAWLDTLGLTHIRPGHDGLRIDIA